MKKTIAFAGALAAAFACRAEFGIVDQSVEVMGAVRTVKIEYTLGSVPAIVTIDVKTNGTSIGTANITHFTGDVNKLVTKTGQKCTAYWQSDKSWPGHTISDAMRTRQA